MMMKRKNGRCCFVKEVDSVRAVLLPLLLLPLRRRRRLLILQGDAVVEQPTESANAPPSADIVSIKLFRYSSTMAITNAAARRASDQCPNAGFPTSMPWTVRATFLNDVVWNFYSFNSRARCGVRLWWWKRSSSK